MNSKNKSLLIRLLAGILFLVLIFLFQRRSQHDTNISDGGAGESQAVAQTGKSTERQTNAADSSATPTPGEAASSTANQNSPSSSENTPRADGQNAKENSRRVGPTDHVVGHQEFADLIVYAIKTLPVLDDLKGLDDEKAHHLPPAVFQKIRILGTLADAIESNPELRKDVVPFYRTCAYNEDYIPAVRGRCLANYKRYSSELGIDVSEEFERFPIEIKRLAKFIP